MNRDSCDFKIDPRDASIGIFTVGSYQVGVLIDLCDGTIAAGQTATLHSGKVYILARVTEIDGDSLKGEIIGFENYDEYEYKGRKPSDVIEFTKQEIHGLVN